ncbi:TrxA Thiol-disulfide isomerase and thioredoxins [uncultured Caudovirales phage]|uniref:TrxA Thiol-disulfide isomerase and thioredoxins n=1 Tax=uncultured Caudovirales phage TaxID=2100421 RepID=A0A6J5TBG9_9CAUD|nr:TrxA Thiol-disulfide isomerase and thioredoxins [uncultured Caudovirales phage]CAB5219556.1 TrxA Thiol-disulfide isomerase and thioredoxins [uncultured Caudovirales phage]
MQKLIHFTAAWCQPCKAMAPMIDKFVSEHPDIEYVKYDIDLPESGDAIEEFGVRGVPTFVVLENEEIKNRHTGSATSDKFSALFA